MKNAGGKNADWLKDAVFYQIYPLSFFDGNGDGIGDLNGITEKIGYLKSLGINAVWLSPFYESPFMDGGYDVSDYRKTDPKFGSMADFEKMLAAFKKNGIRVVIDLVIGHTSFKHKWFLRSAEYERNEYSDYYIWTDSNFNQYKDRTIHGLFDRDAGYYINYYACQPALNYGFNRLERAEEKSDCGLGTAWQMHYTDARLAPLREEILSVMRFWLDKGVDGFRVDLAHSLVKGCIYNSDKDEDTEGLQWLWGKFIEPIKKEYPNCVFIAEWFYAKNAVGKCGFDVDFYSHEIEGYNDLFRNEPGSNLLPFLEHGKSYFSKEGKGSVNAFLKYALEDLGAIEGKGYIAVPTGSHDQIRISKYRDEDVLKTVFAFLLTFKHVPFIYYGDEIGLSYREKINRDGGYVRTGSRTPMQWNDAKNRGFSCSDTIYLPVNNEKAQSVAVQEKTDTSLLATVKKLTEIRKKHTCLHADGSFKVVYKGQNGYPLVYERANAEETLTVAINPSSRPYEVEISGETLFAENAKVADGKLLLSKCGFAIIRQS